MYKTRIGAFDLPFETSPTLFSPRRLDARTAALVRRAAIEPGEKVLDLGCGYGPAGVYAAKITSPSRVWPVTSIRRRWPARA
jgi:16S rRNA (guanine1207-N2)-methyltransferase